MEALVPTLARFLTPLVGLIVGLIFALIFLQATKPSLAVLLPEEATPEDFERARQQTPPVVLFWPVSTGLYSIKWPGRSPADLVWARFPTTLQVMFLAGGYPLRQKVCFIPGDLPDQGSGTLDQAILTTLSSRQPIYARWTSAKVPAGAYRMKSQLWGIGEPLVVGEGPLLGEALPPGAAT